ncbi:NAD(P)-dependent oxidoreductase [Flavobacteriales bacterium]|nr:NAD(P)-dependent oxidoreductase [Flavobacteriales bacterium]
MKIGVLRESKTPPDKRVVLTPHQCVELLKQYPETELVVQPSQMRKFSDLEYSDLGISLQEDLSDCDVLFGVKEVLVDSLIEGKKYFFFSHTIKKQSHNRDLLRRVLALKITLVDYEVLTDSRGRRLVGFGRYAGIVGCYNAFLTLGRRTGLFDLKRVYTCDDRTEMEAELKKMQLSNIKIVTTGTGRVGKGVKELLDIVGVRQVSIHEFLNHTFKEAVYVQLETMDYFERSDHGPSFKPDFYDNPSEYRSDFMKFAQVADVFIAGHFHAPDAPPLFTPEDAKSSKFKIRIVSDISCDINGPVASTIRPSSIENPIYGYHPESASEDDFDKESVISVVAIDNLPCELPKDASEGFGAELLENVFPHLLKSDDDGILERATLCDCGVLTKPFNYLNKFVKKS